MPATFPDTTLKDDTVDPLYGGRPAPEFGGLSWQWVSNVLQFLGQAFLDYLRQPYRDVVVVAQGAIAPGDVVVVDLNAGATAGAYVARTAAVGDVGNPSIHVLGVAVVGAGAGAKARVATHGLLPRQYTGFSSLPGSNKPLSVDYTLGKLKMAGGGDVVLAYGDPRGNALLLPPARLG